MEKKQKNLPTWLSQVIWMYLDMMFKAGQKKRHWKNMKMCLWNSLEQPYCEAWDGKKDNHLEEEKQEHPSKFT